MAAGLVATSSTGEAEQNGTGKLKAFFRDRRAIAIYAATSTDDGENWVVYYILFSFCLVCCVVWVT